MGGGGRRRREGAIRATCGPVIIYPRIYHYLGEGVGGFWLCHNKNYLINLSCVVIFL